MGGDGLLVGGVLAGGRHGGGIPPADRQTRSYLLPTCARFARVCAPFFAARLRWAALRLRVAAAFLAASLRLRSVRPTLDSSSRDEVAQLAHGPLRSLARRALVGPAEGLGEVVRRALAQARARAACRTGRDPSWPCCGLFSCVGAFSAVPNPSRWTASGSRSVLVGLALLDLPSSCAITSGSRSVVTSPSSRPSAMSRSSRRMILPERVLGRSSAQMMRLGRASLPILLATCSRISSTSSSSPSLVALERHEGGDRLARVLVCLADHRGLGDLLVRDDRRLDLGGRHAVARDVEHVVDAPDDPEVAVLVACARRRRRSRRRGRTSPSRSR